MIIQVQAEPPAPAPGLGPPAREVVHKFMALPSRRGRDLSTIAIKKIQVQPQNLNFEFVLFCLKVTE